MWNLGRQRWNSQACGTLRGKTVEHRAQLYDSCKALDVGPQPISQLEREQGAKLVRDGLRWIKSFDREAVEATYYKRFASDQQRVPGLRLAGEPVLCLGARLGGEVRALTRLGALAIGIDFNPGFRNPHVLWGDALSLQFADATFKVAYTNVLDHIDASGIGVVTRHVYRVLKPGGIARGHRRAQARQVRAVQFRDSRRRRGTKPRPQRDD